MDSVGSPLMNLRDVTMIYRFINGPALTYLSASLFKRSETHSCNTRNKDLLSFPMCRTSASSSASERGFYYRARNNLSVAIRNSHSVSQFKRSVKRKMLRTKHEVWLDLVMIFSYTYLNVNKLFVLCLLIKM